MVSEGQLLWEPSESFIRDSNLHKYMDWLENNCGLTFEDYRQLWNWSVTDVSAFWATMWEYFNIHAVSSYQQVLSQLEMPGCVWFEGARLNYAEHILRAERSAPTSKVAIYHKLENGTLNTITWSELGSAVRRLATSLRALGVVPGDRVVSFMPNIPETVIAMLATTSIGAIWSSSAPEFGVNTVVERFEGIQPKVLFAANNYPFAGKTIDCESKVNEIISALPTLKHIVGVSVLGEEIEFIPNSSSVSWQRMLAGAEVNFDDFMFEYVAHDHPLWILFSSGTTGLPKAITQSHVGILLEHYKLTHIHMGLTEKSRLFFYTTTGWMMWNVVIAGLLSGGAIVLYEGSPVYPSNEALWALSEEAGVTYFGSSATFLQMMGKNNVVPSEKYNLSTIQATLVGGSPVGPELFDWFYRNVKRDVWFSSQSGGTETCTCLVTAIPTQPVYAGEIQVPALGIDVHAWNDKGVEVIDEVGELVVCRPFPSMPIFFWGDKDGTRFKESYFDAYPNVWRHGDYIKFNGRRGCYIYGRSDATLNRYGVRLGTAEIYRAVEQLDAVSDSIVVCCELPGNQFFMPMFVVLKQGYSLTEELVQEIRSKLISDCSPRHVPEKIYVVEEIPYTLTGKKMEVPVRKILMGWPLEKAASKDAMKNPNSIEFFLKFAQDSKDYNWRNNAI